MHRRFAGLLTASCAVGLIVSGCGRDTGPTGVKVTGSVVKDSQPQDGVRLGFIPPEIRSDMPPRGATTDAAGKFELKLLPGKYTVTLSRPVDKDGKVPGPSDDPTKDFTQLEASGLLKQSFPAKYADPMSTPLSVEIPAEGKELPPLEVKP